MKSTPAEILLFVPQIVSYARIVFYVLAACAALDADPFGTFLTPDEPKYRGCYHNISLSNILVMLLVHVYAMWSLFYSVPNDLDLLCRPSVRCSILYMYHHSVATSLSRSDKSNALLFRPPSLITECVVVTSIPCLHCRSGIRWIWCWRCCYLGMGWMLLMESLPGCTARLQSLAKYLM